MEKKMITLRESVSVIERGLNGGFEYHLEYKATHMKAGVILTGNNIEYEHEFKGYRVKKEGIRYNMQEALLTEMKILEPFEYITQELLMGSTVIISKQEDQVNIQLGKYINTEDTLEFNEEYTETGNDLLSCLLFLDQDQLRNKQEMTNRNGRNL